MPTAPHFTSDQAPYGSLANLRIDPGTSGNTAAAARRDAYYHRLIAEGDTLWARAHSYREISDMHRRAAMSLGIEREWAYVPVHLQECPACGEKVKAGVAVCKHCHAILDAEKAAQHGLSIATASPVQPKNAIAPRTAASAPPSAAAGDRTRDTSS